MKLNWSMIEWIIFWVVIITFAVLFLTSCTGNKVKPYDEPNTPVEELTPMQIVSTFDYKTAVVKLQAEINTLKTLNWFQSAMLVGMFAAGLAWILCPVSMKTYCAAAFGLCLVMFGIAYALQEWRKPFSLACLGVGVTACGVGLWAHRKEWFATKTALVEVVQGIEKAKIEATTNYVLASEKTPATVKEIITNAQFAIQSPATTALVETIRETL